MAAAPGESISHQDTGVSWRWFQDLASALRCTEHSTKRTDSSAMAADDDDGLAVIVPETQPTFAPSWSL